jgi:hypothetical protein
MTQQDNEQTHAHDIVYRDIGWLEEGQEQSAELPVCGQCVPKNAHFARREDVPVGACTMRRASIRLDALGGGTVEVGGHDISDAVRGFTLTGEVGHMPRLVLDLRVFTGEAVAEGEVHIPDETAATLVVLGWTPPPRLVKVDGVLTEGDADTAREALRQMSADPHGLQAGMIVKPYTERGEHKWVFRCWGTDTCDGWLSLDHTTKTSAESARDRHLAEAHTATAEQP